MTSHKIDALEAILFAWHEPIPLPKIAEVLEISEEEAVTLAMSLSERLRQTGGLALLETPGGFRLMTKSEFAEYVERLREPQKIRLSKPALEALAIVCYRQPITRVEIDAIRGVDSSGTLQTLVDRGLVMPMGRKEAAGRPVLYGTTPDFLEHFGLRDISELPQLPDNDIAVQTRTLIDRQEEFVAESTSQSTDSNEETETVSTHSESDHHDVDHAPANAGAPSVGSGSG
jgi:segregation and condensation protein B